MMAKLLVYFLILSTMAPFTSQGRNQITADQVRAALPTGATIKFLEINPGDVLVCGELNVVQGESGSMLHSVGFFAKLDPAAALLWLKTYSGDEHNSINALIKIEDGYLLVGSSHSRYGSTFMIIKTDLNGDAQWIKYSGDGQQTGVKSISIISDGVYLISGSITNWDSEIASISLIVDKNGNFQ
jgi:hypothetical protein